MKKSTILQHTFSYFKTFQVNLDSVTRDQIRENVSKATRGLFDDAQHRIEALMQKDSYNR